MVLRTRRRTGGLLAVVVAASLLWGVTVIAPLAQAAQVVEPHADPFYVPPAGYETTAPGTVLRTRSVTVTGLGIPLPVRSTQALVRSTDTRGAPMAVVTTVMVPNVPSLLGPRPLLSYQPAIDSLGDHCQPSYTLRTGTEKEIPSFLPALLSGWAVAVTDYQGPHNAYGAGRLEGQATLDGIRGALTLPGTGLAGRSTKVVVWGYSGGALATGWAAQLQPSYAPEIRLVGAAAGGTPSDLEAAGRQIDGSLFSGLFLAAAIGVSREYPEVLELLNDAGQALVQEYNDLCVTEESSRHSFDRLAEFTTVPDPLGHPLVQQILTENRMGAVAPATPVYLYHSLLDQLIPYATAQRLNAEWCQRGATVQFVTDVLSEHVVYAITGAPAAFLYLADRVVGRPAPNTCG